MTRIRLTLWALLIGLTALWLLADPTLISGPLAFSPVRNALINYTGIVGIAAMSIAMLLALKPVFAETWFDGLDKMYRLHKWLGITGLVFSVLHWLAAKGPKWLIDLGLMERTQRGPRPEITDPMQRFFSQQRGLAEGLGEWAFYGAAILIVLALVKWFPYRLFHKTHIWLAPIYLVLAYHAVILMKFAYWGEVIGPVMALLLLAGSAAAIANLMKSFGLKRGVRGVVETIEHHTANNVLRVDVKLMSRWSGHEAGQFAFLTFDPKEGPHPFTIASAWQNDGRLTFLIKELGDYTRTLPATLETGASVEIEGPFGRFDFHPEKPRQIWIAGGIGISPFIARMQALAARSDAMPVDLFFSTAAPNVAEFLPRLRERAQAAGVALHVLQSPRDGFLKAADIMAKVPAWQEADVWFCGPAAFGAAMRRDLEAAGLASSAFHQEYFEMR